ncbi:hypothetical protein RAB80_014266 [Fusarium oxysporum f. sp. vasinfectum]|nr:hypothetical protein RAB80_014266 [Fusarium oxysporum f. sp. vasinfectum]
MKIFTLIAPLLSLPLVFASLGGDYGNGYGERVKTVTATTETKTVTSYKPPVTKYETKTRTVTKYKTKTKTVSKKPYPTYDNPGYGDGGYKDGKKFKA